MNRAELKVSVVVLDRLQATRVEVDVAERELEHGFDAAACVSTQHENLAEERRHLVPVSVVVSSHHLARGVHHVGEAVDGRAGLERVLDPRRIEARGGEVVAIQQELAVVLQP